MISVCYTSEQYFNDTRRLTRWLRCRPWAGPDHAEDLAQDAALAAIERQHRGLKPRAMGYLAKDAAKRGKLLHDLSSKTEEIDDEAGKKHMQRRKLPIRREIEQQTDLTTLMVSAPSQGLPDHLQDALELIQRVGNAQLRHSVQLILQGDDLAEAARTVGVPYTSLRRALAVIGSKIMGCGRAKKRPADPHQLDLFGGPEEEQ